MDISSMFTTCLKFLGSIFLSIFDFLGSVYLVPNVSMLDFSLGLSMFALLVVLVRGLFGGNDR